MYQDNRVHFKMYRSFNTACLTGDAHATRTNDISKVTCDKCKSNLEKDFKYYSNEGNAFNDRRKK